MNSNRLFKDAIYQQLARIGHAVSNAKRFELLDLLCQGSRTVEVLAREGNASVANTSQHLRVLRNAGLVESQKKGLHITYRISDPAVSEFLRSVRLFAENRLAEVERIARHFFESHTGLEAVDREELVSRTRRGGVTIIDVRPTEEYQAGHIPGAISIPLKQLQSRMAALPRSKKIVAYCRGPYCVLSVEAVELLRANGFRAARLEDGVQDWRALGYAVAVEDP
ncbi:MAG: metalloregulator ArsR/SmtB family transcription factor [Acidocella sp.]|nr:metalloregulator ArsR/SmtB family transcription factor [Acidocella sp.]